MNIPAVILIVDDDPVVHESLSIYLKAEGYKIVSAFDGEDAINKFKINNPDLILLDLMMPKLSGTEVCREIRKNSNVPIMMLTARGEEIDRILGLELGADDYIVKPFSPREVLARIKAIFRRTSESDTKHNSVLQFPGITISIDNYSVIVDGVNVGCTPKEVEILYLLASNAGQVMDREKILNHIWGYDYFGDTRTVDTHIKRIRNKINCDKHQYALVTVYGVGYKFEPGVTNA